MRYLSWRLKWLVAVSLCAACGSDDGGGLRQVPAAVVRAHIEELAPAVIGHRGTGPTRAGHELPENSLSSFLAALEQGADGVELDVQLTADGTLVLLHDQLEDTTTCSGCVNELTLAEVRQCSLVDGDRVPTDEHPPTLAEVYEALPQDALINVEIKFLPACIGSAIDATQLAQASIDVVREAGGEERTFFSSFSLDVAAAVKQLDAELYSALLVNGLTGGTLEAAGGAQLDAIHPLAFVRSVDIESIRNAGFQVNVWSANSPEQMRDALAKGVSSIITDDPATLRRILDEEGE
jgi:glycerophosphoryl diester phosphodiesterase